METNELIDFLIEEIDKVKDRINYYVDIHYLTEEALWRGELAAYLKIVTFIYRKTDDVRLIKILNDEYKQEL